MASVNKVILVGNLGADPETRYAAGGEAVTSLRVATTDRFRDKGSGERKQATEWHRCVLFGRQAEVASTYLKKGAAIYLEGALRTRSWEKHGTKHYATEIRVAMFQMLGERSAGNGFDDMDDELPGSRPTRADHVSNPAQGVSTGTTRAASPPPDPDDFDDLPF
ncbi:single-stranded DNA-binding protein [Paraburkholderia sp. MM6662-R1]|uniref:single-stranded DNA-binding protein n=1 Tax=Paraburkholderia sp. MM6662-R1 TaxID=2991066 RepID=UPI003D1D5E75